MKLDLQDAEVDAILTLLGQHPFNQVAGLINKIMAQANDPRLNPPPSSVVPQV